MNYFLITQLFKGTSPFDLIINRHGISVSKMTMAMFLLSKSQSDLFAHSYLITVCLTRVTRRVPLVLQELFTLQQILSRIFSGVRIPKSLVFYLVFCRSLSVHLSFRHCVVCLAMIYDFSLPILYLQTLH